LLELFHDSKPVSELERIEERADKRQVTLKGEWR